MARLPKIAGDSAVVRIELLIDLKNGQITDCAIEPEPRFLSRLLAALLIGKPAASGDSAVEFIRARYASPWQPAIATAIKNAIAAAIQLQEGPLDAALSKETPDHAIRGMQGDDRTA